MITDYCPEGAITNGTVSSALVTAAVTPSCDLGFEFTPTDPVCGTDTPGVGVWTPLLAGLDCTPIVNYCATGDLNDKGTADAAAVGVSATFQCDQGYTHDGSKPICIALGAGAGYGQWSPSLATFSCTGTGSHNFF